MRLVSPVDRFDEAAALFDAGADELYGGYVPAAWRQRFSLLASINQRTFDGAQLSSRDELAAVIALAKARGKAFSLTLNAPFYNDEQYPLLLEVVDEAVAAGVDGIILADLGLLRTLRVRHPRLEFHASTLAHAMNSAAVAFLLSTGISRTVLPRHLTLAEMAYIVANAPGHRFDAFVLIGKCPNTEGLCTFHHSSPEKVWPCEIPYTLAPAEMDSPPSARLQGAVLRQASWAHTDRRHGCGLCAIPALARLGLHGLKLVGRGAPTQMKVANLRLVREFVALAGEGIAEGEYCRRARLAHRRRFAAPCSANVCYYPEFFQHD